LDEKGKNQSAIGGQFFELFCGYLVNIFTNLLVFG